MENAAVASALCGALLLCSCSASPPTTAGQPTTAVAPAADRASATPIILEKNEGERRVIRGWAENPNPGETFILKIDPKNGHSSHMVFMTAELKPGGMIPTHRHPGSDEILFLQNGTAHVTLGDMTRDVHAGATVFIPADTWIAVTNNGKEPITLIGVMSSPGFEDFMRAESVLEGEKNVQIPDAEDEAAQRMHSHDVIYKQP